MFSAKMAFIWNEDTQHRKNYKIKPSQRQRAEHFLYELSCRNNESKIAAFPGVQERTLGSQSPTSKSSYLTAAY